MFCGHCGKEVGDYDSFCGNCGKPVRGAVPTAAAAREKSAGLALFFGLVIPGMGILYSGKVGEGILYFMGSATLGAVVLAALLAMSASKEALEAYSGIYLLTFMAMFALYVFSAYSGYGYAKEYNERLRRDGVPPW